jgi:hypothetical protein
MIFILKLTNYSIARLLTKAVSIGLFFGSCASTNDDAISQQEDFIKNHPTWNRNDFNFQKRKPEINVLEVIEKINENKKIDAKLDSIILSRTEE